MECGVVINFPELASHFQMEGIFTSAELIRNGHIHDTYQLSFRKANGHRRRYIVQRINQNVFKHPEQVMENIQAVTSHLRRKIVAAGGDPDRETLTLTTTKEGGIFYISPEDDYWRAYYFVENAKTYETAQLPEHIFHAGLAFGNFQSMLADFPANQLFTTIPDFHNTRKRLADFIQAVTEDRAGRARSTRPDIDFILERASHAPVLVELHEQGALPERVTHNDTKFNNVLIDDATGRGVCVIDLDTVMPGLALYDFGDAIRSAANTASEDEPDVTQVHFDLEVYATFARGYLQAMRASLTPLEKQYLAFAARLITLEQGMRFLGDYLNDDVYYKIHHPDHNLERARTQLKLVAEMETNTTAMEKIIHELI